MRQTFSEVCFFYCLYFLDTKKAPRTLLGAFEDLVYEVGTSQ